MALCSASRYPVLCTLGGSRLSLRDTKTAAFCKQGLVTYSELQAGERCLQSRPKACLCVSDSKSPAVWAFSLLPLKVRHRRKRLCSGVCASVPARDQRVRRSALAGKSAVCSKGPLVKGFGEGVFRTRGQSRGSTAPEAASDDRGFYGEASASDKERIESGRAATTSGSNPSQTRGQNQQLTDPPEAAEPAASSNRVGQKERGEVGPKKPLLKKKGREVLKKLIGVQAAWLSAPLLALAQKTKKTEAKRRGADAPKRKPRSKRTAGLAEGDAQGLGRGETGVEREETVTEGGGGQKLAGESLGKVAAHGGSEVPAGELPGMQNGKAGVSLSKQISQEGRTSLTTAAEEVPANGANSKNGAVYLNGSAGEVDMETLAEQDLDPARQSRGVQEMEDEGASGRGDRKQTGKENGAQNRQTAWGSDTSGLEERSEESRNVVPFLAGAPEQEVAGEAAKQIGPAGWNGFARTFKRDAPLEGVAGQEGSREAVSANGFARDKAVQRVVESHDRSQKDGERRGLVPSGLRAEPKNGVSKTNGFGREDFLLRLERVQKGLGAKAEVLANEAGVAAAADRLRTGENGQSSEGVEKVLLSLGVLNDPLPTPAEGSRVGRAGNWRSRRALKGVGTRSTSAAAAARAEQFGGLEMTGDGTPRDGEDAAGGAVDWGDGPLKRDANTAVAQMVASSKRFQRLRQLAQASVKGEGFPEAVSERVGLGTRIRDGKSQSGVGDGLREAFAAVERVVQNGTAKAEGRGEGRVSGEGLRQGLAEKEGGLQFESRRAASNVLRDGLAANGRMPQRGAVETGVRTIPGGNGGEIATGVEHSVPAALDGVRNGAPEGAFRAREPPAGRADRNGLAEREGLMASTDGHATPGALTAGEKAVQNGALEGRGVSEEGKSVPVVEGSESVEEGSVPVLNGAVLEGSETEAVASNGKAARLAAASNGHASSVPDAALYAERSENGAARRNGSLNGAAARDAAESERHAFTSLQLKDGFRNTNGPTAKDQLENPVQSPRDGLHESANGMVLVGVRNGAALLETGSSVRAEGRLNDGVDSTNGVALKSAPVLVAVSRVAEDGTSAGAGQRVTVSGVPLNAVVLRGAGDGAGDGSNEGGSVAVPIKSLPPPLPIKKRKSAEKMIERSKRPGGPSTGRSDGSPEQTGRRSSVPGGPEDAPVLVTASRKIGEEAQAIEEIPVVREQPKTYTLEEDEKLFEALGVRLTGQEMSRIAEWLKSQEVPELKLARPRDRTGRYFLMPVIKAVEKHLREHGRLRSENDVATNAPTVLAETAGGKFPPGAAAGPAGGENGDEFFQAMSEELSADVVLRTQELLANQDPAGGSETVGSGTPTEKKAEFSDFFEDDSDSDVETLFQRAGLTTDGRRQRRLESLEKAVIAEYLMGLNKQGADPPRKEDWPCAPDGERYSRETLRGVWREADEMGGLPAYLKLCQEEEAIERLLVESLSRGRPLKGEDWRELTAEETRAVDGMHPGERASALEFMLGLLRGGERLDWKKHRDVWPRKVRTAHLIKARLLLALVKVARRRGGLEAYLEESRRELERRSDSPGGLLASTSEPYDDLLESDADSDLDDDSEESSEFASARAGRFATGGWKEAKIDPAVSASATGVGWRAASFARGANSEANGSPSGGAQGSARQYDQSGGLGRTLADSLGTPTRLFNQTPQPVDRPSPVDPDPSKIPRGFPVRRPKEPVPRDPGSGFATWRVPSSDPPRQFSPSRTSPPSPANSRRGGMIRSAADSSALSRLADGALFPGGDPSQQSDPPVLESAPTRRWLGLYDARQAAVEPEGPVSSTVDTFPAHERETASNAPQNGASRELSPIERRRRRRLLGIKVQRNENAGMTDDDVSGQGGDDVTGGGVFEVVGRQPRSMREVLSGYAQETVLMRAEELAQPVLVEDNMRAGDEEGLLERLVTGHKSEMEEFKDTSKQYMRTWQDFQTWSDFFQVKNKRMPTVTDVESTCIPWLIEKAKAYVVLRKHMIKLAEGNEKLLIAMAAIQAELNKRSTASIAIEKSAEYQRQTKPASKRPVKRRGRGRKELTDPVAGPIIEAFDNGNAF
ncbi:hypothetical protein KFL_001320050 [Klebsormidium nitens]|uniref:Uncharacterized protein n=1 Tax=Klebsormidium nitens TaxID=105231 RepID=A0A1Y1I2L8_KLENI|nr:hypothetical protein KFL_001320050 [Klebsormidium nitens]|eukprot:GAQ82997.1 hypothetical protein KFL_001320050 [Klebsormidium nitens]